MVVDLFVEMCKALLENFKMVYPVFIGITSYYLFLRFINSRED